jgi:drug/metabolite transporter (DMT)-like permease
MTLTDNMRGALLMNAAMLAFTLNDTCVKLVMENLPLFQVIALRGIMATAMLVVIAIGSGQLRFGFSRRDTTVLTIRTAAEILASLFFLAALVHMPLANLTSIMQSVPLAVTLAGALVFGDRVGWRRMTAILVGFAGVMLIVKPGTEVFDVWSLMGICAVLAVVVRDLSVRRLSAAVPSMTVAVWASVAVTLMGLIGGAFEGWRGVSMTDLIYLAAAAVTLIIGYLTVVMTMRVGDTGIVAPFRYTALIWAILLGWLSFGTLPDALTLLGAAVVIATGLFTFWRERRLALIASPEI